MFDRIVPRSRRRIATENRAELEAWIDERTEALVAQGVDPDAARLRALEEFGDVGVAMQYAERQDVAAERRARIVMWFQELASDLRIAARTLARTPTVTVVVLLTFALGIGATTAVFSVVHALLLRPLPYGDEQTLMYLPAVDNGVIRPGLGGARHGAATLVSLRERTTSFSGIAALAMGNMVLTENGDPEQLFVASLTPDAFDVLQARAAIGRTFREGEKNVVVLLDALWRRRFAADSAVVGRIIQFGDGDRREVIGVMPPDFRVPTYEQTEFLAPQVLTNILRNQNSAQTRAFRLIGRLKAGVSPLTAQADLDRAMHALEAELPRFYSGLETRVVPIRTGVAGDAKPQLLVLMGASVFVLLIACANVAGILLSRAVARRHELAVRVALGAGRRRLIRQFLAEGAVLAMVGAALGVAFAAVGVSALRHIAAATLPVGTTFALEPRVLVFAIATAVVAAFVSSLAPALGATRAIGSALHRDDGRASLSPASRRMRFALVAAQLAVSVVLLVGAGLFLRTLQQLSALKLGYSIERTLTFRPRFVRNYSNAEQDAYYAALYTGLRAIPGVMSVGGGNVPATGEGTLSGLEIEGRVVERNRLPDARYTAASDDYFATLGIPVVRGRTFNAGDRDGAPWVAIVSAGLARQLWPNEDPIGVRVKPGPDREWATVVGVVGDVYLGGAAAPQPSVYTSQRQDHWPAAGSVILRATGDPTDLSASIREAVKRVDATVVLTGLRTLEDIRRGTPAIADRRLQMQLITAFALVALLVSAIGVYGVNAYATQARQREFGIRIALGASRSAVVWLALRDGTRAAAMGALIGVPIALVLASRVREMFYAVTPFDPMTLSAALGALVLVVFAASVVPARRAALIDPARTMRTD